MCWGFGSRNRRERERETVTISMKKIYLLSPDLTILVICSKKNNIGNIIEGLDKKEIGLFAFNSLLFCFLAFTFF